MNKANAMSVKPGQILYSRTLRNANGTPTRCRVTGKCQTWVTRPDDFKLPVKHGLKNCFYIDWRNAVSWCVTEQEALA